MHILFAANITRWYLAVTSSLVWSQNTKEKTDSLLPWTFSLSSLCRYLCLGSTGFQSVSQHWLPTLILFCSILTQMYIYVLNYIYISTKINGLNNPRLKLERKWNSFKQVVLVGFKKMYISETSHNFLRHATKLLDHCPVCINLTK